MKILPLTNRQFINISGKDCLEFLQGLITVDIHKLSNNNPLWGGMLSPQGKALFDFFLYALPNYNNTILIDIHATFADDFISHLQKYILRSDVKITLNHDLSVCAVWDTDNPSIAENDYICYDPRTQAIGYRHIATQDNHKIFIDNYNNNLVDYDEYKTLRIENNIIDVAVDMPNMDYYWLEINAEAFNGVDFHKGCYVGQEVTARMKHKTELKRQIIPVFVMGSPDTPAVMATDIKEIGTLVCLDSWTGKGLAYVYLNRWEDAIETLRSVTIGMCMVKKDT